MGTEITVLSSGDTNDYISLTDIARFKNAEAPADVVKNLLRTRFAIEFLGIWEKLHNPDFKLVDFDQFIHESGGNAFVLSPQKQGMSQPQRIETLHSIAKSQLEAIARTNSIMSLKTLDSRTAQRKVITDKGE